MANPGGGFHGEKSVAQLKPLALDVDAFFRRGGFHGEKSVAQLKRIGRGRYRTSRSWFPRRKIRGPIEAPTSGIARCISRRGFHGEKSVAQLKQVLYRLDPPGSFRFHGEKSVAQLKPAQVCSNDHPGRWFPRRKIRGPIEAFAHSTHKVGL